ncbi:NAD(P) transhydrogenase subunit alpha [Pseudomaricurvus alcaniphilus]|uniref:NAD(P) transhydrogenase subunit alpha n=1 Tax=Pseudomaricurvus alcaniphilus TaxID=1166482 RepID=UPI001408ED05|nr:NAD(P) transhydrogenase subunit alpha [Pseudomaricurvus alcaniphilus]NHN39511.1 NAD(P) transhydrogenase subunit alpha [Pseudomaricurvus alcaniphilus]
MEVYIFLTFILMLSVILGFELIHKVPATLHTPLMSASNAISGITLIGAIVLAGKSADPQMATLLGAAAVAFATINVVGGYMVTDRMLGMFKKKGDKK